MLLLFSPFAMTIDSSLMAIHGLFFFFSLPHSRIFPNACRKSRLKIEYMIGFWAKKMNISVILPSTALRLPYLIKSHHQLPKSGANSDRIKSGFGFISHTTRLFLTRNFIIDLPNHIYAQINGFSRLGKI